MAILYTKDKWAEKEIRETTPFTIVNTPGTSQPSFDKQFVRDWLKENPDSGYLLPEEVVEKTVDKYKEAYGLLTGEAFA